MRQSLRVFTKKSVYCSLSVIFYCLLSGCAQFPVTNWQAAMQEKMVQFGMQSRRSLSPLLRQRGLTYPVAQLALLILKKSKRLELYGKNAGGRWKYIKTYPVLAASGHAGPKLHAGDRQVPEGVYRIVGLNPLSRFDLSMRLNYPNAFDMAQANAEGRRHLGGDIYIHGDQRSIGCVAIGNKAIEELFPLVYKTGIEHVDVLIAPLDLRQQPPPYRLGEPRWLPALYVRLLNAIEQFPEPSASN